MIYVKIDNENKDNRDELYENKVMSLTMGSHSHGLADESSDSDIIHVYYDNGYSSRIHDDTNGWQYKTDDGVDENYQELRVFVRNILRGSDVATYESLFGEITYHTDSEYLRELVDKLKAHMSYVTLKAYLGYIRKDAHNISNFAFPNFDSIKEKRSLRKMVTHYTRGIKVIESIINDNGYPSIESELTKEVITIKDGTHDCYESRIAFTQYFNELNDTYNTCKDIISNGLGDKYSRRISAYEYDMVGVLLFRTVNEFSKLPFSTIDYFGLDYCVFNYGLKHDYKREMKDSQEAYDRDDERNDERIMGNIDTTS